MVLVDTSVWISHLREGNAHLRDLLLEGAVFCHPFVIIELALGRLRNREEILSLLRVLPQPEVAENEEILGLIGGRRLAGAGIGLVDVHLLASALLANVSLWTTDSRLRKVAARMGVLYQ